MEENAHLAISVVLLYEHFLTMDQEACLHLAYFVTCPNHVSQIKFIWKNHWKPSSVLYIFVRASSEHMISLLLTLVWVGSIFRNTV
ncbi:hypothetical protein V8B97DRAFT_1922849 [Scleroderma yunnanense]